MHLSYKTVIRISTQDDLKLINTLFCELNFIMTPILDSVIGVIYLTQEHENQELCKNLRQTRFLSSRFACSNLIFTTE